MKVEQLSKKKVFESIEIKLTFEGKKELENLMNTLEGKDHSYNLFDFLCIALDSLSE